MTQFHRHPDLIDRPRTRSDYSEGAELGLSRPAEGLAAVLFALVFLSASALASLAADGASFAPLLAIIATAASLLLLSALRAH